MAMTSPSRADAAARRAAWDALWRILLAPPANASNHDERRQPLPSRPEEPPRRSTHTKGRTMADGRGEA